MNATATPPLMQGSPPPADAHVTLANWRTAPFNRWAFQHVRELVPTALVACDPSTTRPLPAADAALDLDAVRYRRHGDGLETSVAQMLDATETDAFLVLHRGRVVAEHYRRGMTARTPHILMSVSKSVTAVIAGMLEHEGALDPAAPVAEYVPETRGSAWDGATVRHLLDMRSGVHFDEEYLAAGGPFIEYRIAMGWNPRPAGAGPTDLRGFLAGMRDSHGPHGGPTRYISPCTDLLGWVVERAAGARFADLLTNRVWQPMGAEHDAAVTVDRLGAPRVAGGVCTTPRDLGRLGLLLLEDGVRDGRRLVPAGWIADTRANGDRDAWRGGDFEGSMSDRPLRYRNQWYVMGEGERCPFFGVGIHGQYLWVDPRSQAVIIKFSSQPEPALDVKDRLTLDGLWALGEALETR